MWRSGGSLTAKTGKKTLLFTLDDVNKWADSDDDHYVRHLMNATFPYPDQPSWLLDKKLHALLDFKKKQIVWQDSHLRDRTANDWNRSRRLRPIRSDNQLFVVDAEGNKHQLTTDGSREIVYGESRTPQ